MSFVLMSGSLQYLSVFIKNNKEEHLTVDEF